MSEKFEVEIAPVSLAAQVAMQERLDHLAKPIKSLGQLEPLAAKLAGIYQSTDFTVRPRTCLVFAADNGVVEEGVSATPKKVTAIQAVNMLNGHTTVAALAKAYDCQVKVTDVGIDTPQPLPKVLNRRIRRGTRNLLHESAMTVEEAWQCLSIGRQMAQQEIAAGAQLIITGELGMGNTTAASAMMATILHRSAGEMVGRGSKISDQRLIHKTAVVEQALRRAGFTTTKTPEPLQILQEVGAYELGAMAGAMLGTAEAGKPLVLDGFLSYAALLLAREINPRVMDYVIPSHQSHEQASELALQALGLAPLIDLQMCVGEGSGAMMMLPWLDGIEAILKNMNTLEEMDFDFIP
ncbi:nicotinate-nucleotide--dimethylbenzimidazole phosphoribosyltransferase [Limosilactobacillus ingluviei]|uniref:nicotinate-nucleotide--dimethylbenzimidazole phosphoribosyltransferase n=1 Tax=Limosilactobacillus ingluviei TaxID=148604 RepID=UPI0023EFAF43|nr:nicotinate-nucleotide--dimethylbenzimidazole phosphoribosyltransferase [Limosilactobacillus ingluviei]